MPEKLDYLFVPRSMTTIMTCMRLKTAQFAITLLFVAKSADAQCRYSVEFPEIPVESPALLVINDSGDAGGISQVGINDIPILRLADGSVTFLERPAGFLEGLPQTIENDRRLTGNIRNDTILRAVLWTPDAAINLGVPPGANYTDGLGMNSFGAIVGEWRNTHTGPVGAFLWRDGKLTDLRPLLTTENCSADDINDSNAIVGWRGVSSIDRRAYLLQGQAIVDIGVTPNGMSGRAVAVNNRLQVAGWGLVPGDDFPNGNRQSFFWRSGTMKVIADPPGLSSCRVQDMNELGQVIGDCVNPDNGDVGFLWQNGKTYRVRDLVDEPGGVQVYDVRSINNVGVMLGSGTQDGVGKTLILRPKNRPDDDIDCDCRVDIFDLFFLLSEWGQSDSWADITGDGAVDVNDLVSILSGWST